MVWILDFLIDTSKKNFEKTSKNSDHGVSQTPKKLVPIFSKSTWFMNDSYYEGRKIYNSGIMLLFNIFW